jgi:hypothetical protein
MFARLSVLRSSTILSRSVPRSRINCNHLAANSFPAWTYSQSRTMATTNGAPAPALEQSAIKSEAHHITNGTDIPVTNNWAQPGPAAFDFRSPYCPHPPPSGPPLTHRV